MFILAFLAIPLFGGAQCSFFFSSGRSNNDSEDKQADAGLVVIVGDGTLVDGPVEGVQYESGSLAGITGSKGEFRYEVGNTVRFSIGDIALGGPVPAKAVITPLDLVKNGAADTPAVINIARLLQSLDSVPGDDVLPKSGRQRSGRTWRCPRLSNIWISPTSRPLSMRRASWWRCWPAATRSPPFSWIRIRQVPIWPGRSGSWGRVATFPDRATMRYPVAAGDEMSILG